MFPMTVTIHDQQQLNALLSAMGTKPTIPATTVVQAVQSAPKTNDADIQALVDRTEAKAKADPKPTAATTEQPAASQPTAEAETAAAPEKKAELSDNQADAPKLEYKDVQKAVVEAVKAGHRTAVVALLKEFGVDHAEKLKAEQWPDAHAKLTALVKG